MRKIICILPLLMSLLSACDLLSGVYDERWLIDYTSPNIGTLKYVPPGSFQRDGTPTNISTVSAFRMSQYEITRAQFIAMVGTDPSLTLYSSSINDPVQYINWYHSIAFCNKLSIAEGLTQVYTVTVSGSPVNFSTLAFGDIPTVDNPDWNTAICDWDANGYRLPTDMEWMWAAMGATSDSRSGDIVNGVNINGYTKGYAGSIEPASGFANIENYAWYDLISTNTTHTVGTKLPNELGLYDMSGNVWEWCWDENIAYPAGQLTDYRPGMGANSVNRGGCWGNTNNLFTLSNKGAAAKINIDGALGFRVVRK